METVTIEMPADNVSIFYYLTQRNTTRSAALERVARCVASDRYHWQRNARRIWKRSLRQPSLLANLMYCGSSLSSFSIFYLYLCLYRVG